MLVVNKDYEWNPLSVNIIGKQVVYFLKQTVCQ